MSKRKPVLPTIRRAIDSSPWDPSQGGWDRADRELRAAEEVIRAARRLPGAAWKLSTFQTLRRALARLDKATWRDRR